MVPDLERTRLYQTLYSNSVALSQMSYQVTNYMLVCRKELGVTTYPYPRKPVPGLVPDFVLHVFTVRKAAHSVINSELVTKVLL